MPKKIGVGWAYRSTGRASVEGGRKGREKGKADPHRKPKPVRKVRGEREPKPARPPQVEKTARGRTSPHRPTRARRATTSPAQAETAPPCQQYRQTARQLPKAENQTPIAPKVHRQTSREGAHTMPQYQHKPAKRDRLPTNRSRHPPPPTNRKPNALNILIITRNLS